MEGDKILMAAGVTAAVMVGAYVIFGPSGSARIRQRRGQIAGLHNFGRTCFLNTLLQALAATPQFIAWLQLNQQTNKKTLISSLLNTLEVINGTHPTLRGDPYSPGTVIRALNSLGWVIPADEHDAHELLHVILSSVEDEATKPKQPVGSLADALGLNNELRVDVSDALVGGRAIQERPSSAMLSDFCKLDYGEAVMRQTRSEAHTPDSPHSTCSDLDETQANLLLDDTLENSNLMRPINRVRTTSSSEDTMKSFQGTLFTKKNSLSLERLSRGPGKVSVFCEKSQIQVPHPFRGAISSQLICSVCNAKSVVRYDKFDSVTLPLPQDQLNPALSLGHLLSEFVASETLKEVKCETCNLNTSHTKTTTFAKLPACLCVHISRNVWLNSGQPYKRQDFVHFPESLSMAPYSFVQPGLSRMGTPWGSTLSLLSNSLPMNDGAGLMASTNYTFGSMFPRNLYRLLAVVVHSGNATTGHFVTYRRGALRNSHRWFYTSDTVVKEVTIEEVLSKPAYLLFYDRGQSKNQ